MSSSKGTSRAPITVRPTQCWSFMCSLPLGKRKELTKDGGLLKWECIHPHVIQSDVPTSTKSARLATFFFRPEYVTNCC